MKFQCLFSHPVTSVFVWSARQIMKKRRKRKYQQIRDLTLFPVIQLSLLHKHRIISSLVSISKIFVVTEFVYTWSFSFHMDFCLTLFWRQVLWLDLGFLLRKGKGTTFRKRTQQLLDDTSWSFLALNTFSLNLLQI